MSGPVLTWPERLAFARRDVEQAAAMLDAARAARLAMAAAAVADGLPLAQVARQLGLSRQELHRQLGTVRPPSGRSK